MDVGLCRK